VLWPRTEAAGVADAMIEAHNAYVYGELLGYSPEEIEQLKRDGHVGDT
jgi:crotonobetainyl-CoA:carnitine CoA-transferase CaiB-like acyl-CoA transferase